jgi:hypothetical protein
LGDWKEPEVGDPEYDDNGDRATDDNNANDNDVGERGGVAKRSEKEGDQVNGKTQVQ